MGSIVICWPGVIGLAIAAHEFQTVSDTELFIKAAVFCLGGTLFHSAFCVYNDICDIEFDGRVERTKTRPLVAKEISLLGAWTAFLTVYLLGIFSMYFAHLNNTAIAFGLLSMPLHFLYPLSKRWTWWPQAWLGLSNGWSFLVGWFTFADEQSSKAQIQASILMYLAMVCWTIYFDTIYATQDRSDDARAGVKSTALLFGDSVRAATSAFAALTAVCMAASGILYKHGVLYFSISCCGAACHFAWQMASWNVNDRKQTGKLFKSNGDWGFIVFAGIIADRAMGSSWNLPTIAIAAA